MSDNMKDSKTIEERQNVNSEERNDMIERYN